MEKSKLMELVLLSVGRYFLSVAVARAPMRMLHCALNQRTKAAGVERAVDAPAAVLPRRRGGIAERWRRLRVRVGARAAGSVGLGSR
jgi:hypothetical protein